MPHGNVLIKNYFAKTTKSWRHIFVYTPPDYETNTTTRYPVLYLQHGGGEDERVWIEMGRTNVILDNLLAERQDQPFIVVMETSAVGGPGPGAWREAWVPVLLAGAPARRAAAPGAPRAGAFGGMGGPGGGAYGQFMVNELIPWVDGNFRTLADQDHRAMAGLSMGGDADPDRHDGQPRQVLAHRPVQRRHDLHGRRQQHGRLQREGQAGVRQLRQSRDRCQSWRQRGAGAPAPAPAAAPAPTAAPAEAGRGGAIPGARPGGMGGFGGNPKASVDALKAAGINAAFYVSPLTAHEFQSWRRSLREFALLLFRDGAAPPLPKRPSQIQLPVPSSTTSGLMLEGRGPKSTPFT